VYLQYPSLEDVEILRTNVICSRPVHIVFIPKRTIAQHVSQWSTIDSSFYFWSHQLPSISQISVHLSICLQLQSVSYPLFREGVLHPKRGSVAVANGLNIVPVSKFLYIQRVQNLWRNHHGTTWSADSSWHLININILTIGHRNI